jgi:hypothetical protein
MVTATFPSSRSANHPPQATHPETSGQVLGGKRIRAVYPRFALLIEELDGHEQPMGWSAYETNKFDPAPITVHTLPDEVGHFDRIAHELHDEVEPFRSAFSDMLNALGRDQHDPLDSAQLAGQNKSRRYDSCDPWTLLPHGQARWPLRGSGASPYSRRAEPNDEQERRMPVHGEGRAAALAARVVTTAIVATKL